ncbi:MAG: hypothetical protein E7555_03430 [Ruminococcaceae bacterium]|nr:hypothetical protein [Oscillospiraceae bacterium]
MKNLKGIKKLSGFSLVMLFVSLFIGTIAVHAVNTRFSAEQLSEKDKNTFLSNVDISLIEEEPQMQSIVCFDVNGDEKIALGYSDSENKTICVYSQNEFLYGYEFGCTGDFAVEWDEENINIYFVRSDIIVIVNQKGDILDIAKVQNTTENNRYHNFLLHSTERLVGDRKYSLRNDMGILNFVASSYSQLTVTDANGTETMLFDVNSSQLAKTVAVSVLITVFVCIAIVVIVKGYKKALIDRKTGK